jgi:hypothetical protein
VEILVAQLQICAKKMKVIVITMVSALAISNVEKAMDTITIVQMSQTSQSLMTAAMILKS